ncbi:MAG: XdhC/CoxI family protein [Acidimicrobiales bacterium]|jgi:xanthine dehydrogenase accessory factor|nr:XdhC/CoxI family protein [Acidimicrobiales bacterium]MDP6299493.1 XdhC/CoxI family protein [Acidimicrobiales bacterium]HJM28050.1 XdhC/CoxI family protein [Acidimicrobiales bacterium]HJM96603.1 XdhC/CoxI family protein [Acidimicrobiales bacterium]
MELNIFERFKKDLESGLPLALATIIEGTGQGTKLLLTSDGSTLGSLGDKSLDRVLTRDMAGELAAGRTSIRHYGPKGEARDEALSIFIESFAPPPQMLIFGAVDFTAALVRVAKILGYKVTVCDARPVFATEERFPQADSVENAWPNDLIEEVGETLGPRDAICVLTHDNKFDVPAITAALDTSVGYIGVMGSRKTHDNRTNRLKEAGVNESQFKRIMSPIGIDLGARTPEETAISICAEIIAMRTGREAPHLKTGEGPIHGEY